MENSYIKVLVFERVLVIIPFQWRIQDLTLGGVWTLSTEGGGRKSSKVLKVEVKVIFKRVFGRISIQNLRKTSVLDIKNHRSATIRGGARRVRPHPPPGSASAFWPTKYVF